jgi:hypothetical protein
MIEGMEMGMSIRGGLFEGDWFQIEAITLDFGEVLDQFIQIRGRTNIQRLRGRTREFFDWEVSTVEDEHGSQSARSDG